MKVKVPRRLSAAVIALFVVGSLALPGAGLAATRPTVTSVSSAVVNQGESTILLITGSGFVRGATVNLGNGISTVLLGTSPSKLTVRVIVDPRAAYGERAVTVTDPGGVSGSLPHALHVDYLATFSRWAVGDGAIGWVTTLTRPALAQAPRIAFAGGGVRVASEAALGNGQVRVVLDVAPDAAANWRSMSITSGVSTWTAGHGLRVRAAPIITRMGGLARGATQTLAVTGKNFEVCAHAVPTFEFSGAGVSVNKVSSSLGTVLYVNVTVAPDAPYGPRDVTMTNCDSGGRSTSRGVFTVTGPPIVTSIPAIAVGVSRVETVLGDGFTTTTKLSVSGSGVALTGTFYVSATKLYVRVTVDPGASIGIRDVTATNANGKTATAPGALVVDARPTVSSISPGRIVAGRSQQETLLGTGILPGAVVSVGTGTSQGANLTQGSYHLVGPGQLQFTLTAAATLPPGIHDVTVFNADGGYATLVGQLTSVVQLAAPRAVTASPSRATDGAVLVAFSPPANAPGGQGYEVRACTDKAMSVGCVTSTVSHSGDEVTGLVPGGAYFVSVTALASPGYLAATSAPVGPVRATTTWAAPGAPTVRFGAAAGAVIVTFSGSTGAPPGESYAVRACRNAAMSIGCVSNLRATSGVTLGGLAYARGVAGPIYFVQVRANPTVGHLGSAYSVIGSHADTSALSIPSVVGASSPVTGRIKVVFKTGGGAAATSFTVRACQNAAMTLDCTRVAHFTDGGDVTGLPSGRRYYVTVTAVPPTGFVSATSSVRGPVTTR